MNIPSIWHRLPVLLRASLIALAILSVGQIPPGVFLLLGLKLTPRLPWFPAATAVWLLLFWFYLSGRGWPAATAETRKASLRAAPLPPRIWLASLVAGALGMAGALSAALLTARVATLPAEASAPPVDLSPFPFWTVLAFFLNVALVAGVVEEAAFRGYMLSMIERRHGWAIGIASAAVLFYAVHLGHAYATWAFLPFFAAYSALHGMLVFLTRSIGPSVVLHVLGDLVILPIQYGVLPSPLGSSIPAHVVSVVGFGLASVLGLLYLARATGRLQPRRREIGSLPP